MSVFTAKEFDGHEEVVFCHDAASGLRAIIAIHNRNLGPALGGCRMYPYADEADALRDVLRLSRGMTYKSALAGLPLGGGKSVIIGDPFTDKSDALLRAMGRFIDSLGGRYIGAEDSGTTVADLQAMAGETAHVAGIHERRTADGQPRDGDPSPYTAHGVFTGIRSAVRHALGSDSLEGVTVAIQGLGNVGSHLARELHEAGARLVVADPVAARVEAAVERWGARAVALDEIDSAEADVFAPCALGAVINDATVPRLAARIVAGAANNQLDEPRHAEALRARGILYAPDFVINAGGIIDVWYELSGGSEAEEMARIEAIGDTLEAIFNEAEANGQTTVEVAERHAERRFRDGAVSGDSAAA
ncbi:MAG: Glu/Leu/Phe/Val dehydrogenase dimerization domain-containing protein [Gammaproteobacteria bacterium]